jgi:hypothetical protein
MQFSSVLPLDASDVSRAGIVERFGPIDTAREYQRNRDLKPTGALNSDTIRDLAVSRY